MANISGVGEHCVQLPKRSPLNEVLNLLHGKDGLSHFTLMGTWFYCKYVWICVTTCQDEMGPTIRFYEVGGVSWLDEREGNSSLQQEQTPNCLPSPSPQSLRSISGKFFAEHYHVYLRWLELWWPFCICRNRCLKTKSMGLALKIGKMDWVWPWMT